MTMKQQLSPFYRSVFKSRAELNHTERQRLAQRLEFAALILTTANLDSLAGLSPESGPRRNVTPRN